MTDRQPQFTDTNLIPSINSLLIIYWNACNLSESELSIEYTKIIISIILGILAQPLKNLPAMRETWVQLLGWEDPLEKGKATHSNILA